MSELVPYAEGNAAARLREWAEAASAAHALATSLVKTSVCPDAFRGKADEAAAVILLGAELGMDPVHALRAMYPAPGGQIGMYAKAMLALVVRRGHVIWTEFDSDERVVVAGYRDGHPDHVERSEWTIARARQAGFIRRSSSGKPSQYETQPRTMLWSRAVAELANRIAPDAIQGIPELDAPDDTATANPARVRVVQRTPIGEATGRPDRGDATPGAVPQIEPSDRPLSSTLRPRDVVDIDLPSDLSENDGVTSDENADDASDDADEPMLTGGQRARIFAELNARGIRDHDDRVAFLSRVLGRDVESSMSLTATEAHFVITTEFEAEP